MKMMMYCAQTALAEEEKPTHDDNEAKKAIQSSYNRNYYKPLGVMCANNT